MTPQEKRAAIKREQLKAQQSALKSSNKRGLGAALYENIVGVGEVDTPGERAGELIKGGAAAVTRGFADVAALPGNLIDAGIAGSNWVRGKFGLDPINLDEQAIGGAVVGAIPNSQDVRGAVSAVTGGASDYVAPGTAGEYVSTAGEFAGGAGLAAGPRAAIRYGAIPGLASEAAGQLTEGTPMEPWARVAAPIATGIALTPRPTATTLPGERGEAAARLQAKGIRPTAGQIRDSEGLMRVESTLAPTPQQLNQFTRAALAEAGYKGPSMRATPGVLRAQQNQITSGMNRIVNIDVPVTTTFGREALRIADDYLVATPGQNLPVRLRNVAQEIADAATNPNNAPIPGATLRKWRSALGRYTTSSDEAVRDAAHDLREVIDTATESALVGLGRNADVEELAKLRTQYRNLLVIADATTRGGRGGASGVLTPERVSTSAKRILGRQNYAMDKSTPLAQLARDAEMIIGSAPTVKPGGIRDVVNTGAMAASGAIVGAQSGDVRTALMGAVAGATAPTVARELATSGLIQSALTQPQNIFRSLPPMAPGIAATNRDRP